MYPTLNSFQMHQIPRAQNARVDELANIQVAGTLHNISNGLELLYRC